MTASSARPENLLLYTADALAEAEAVPSRAGLRTALEEVRAGCSAFISDVPDHAQSVDDALLLAQELDTWVGLVGARFAQADGAGDGPVTVDDQTIIDGLPPLLADPPAEVRDRVEEGQDLYDAIAAAADEYDHDRLEELLGQLADHEDDEAFLAGLASKFGEGGPEAFEDLIRDGFQEEPRGGFWGGTLDFLDGAWDSIWEAGKFIVERNQLRMYYDPEGYFEAWRQTGEGLWAGVTDPGEFIQALIDVDGFNHNKARWAGQLAPDVILAVLTGGAGTAKRGLSVAKTLDRIRDVADNLRVAKRLSPDVNVVAAMRTLMREFDGDIARSKRALTTWLETQGLDPDTARRIANREGGRAFDDQFNRNYPIYQVQLGRRGVTGGPILDGFDPRGAGEIVSRKHTQLSEVSPATAAGYIDELVDKYAPGTPIKVTPRVLEKAREAGLDASEVPTRLRGTQILEVPPQIQGIPPAVLDLARQHGIAIRATDGTILFRP